MIEPDDTNPRIEVLPQGEVGELAVGGYQLATGYINRPEQTNSVFISSPYGRIYRTGDKARLLPDGRLECLGRLADGQVKLRGQRLELGEVEQAVLRTSGCHSAAAAVVESILVVFCAVDDGVTEADVASKCKDWLPQFMVPGEVILMDEFPRLPSGKVDRKRLKADYQDRRAKMIGDAPDLAPADELETTVTQVVSEALQVKANKATSLAAAGLDSLSAIKLASQLRENGIHLSSVQLLLMKSVSEIVFAARQQPELNRNTPLLDDFSQKASLNEIIAQSPELQGMEELIEDIIPCTPLQSAMLAETAQDPIAYCNEIELKALSTITTEQIQSAFEQLIERHEILRTGFTTWKGKFVSIIFKQQRPGQVVLVDDFQSSFTMSQSKDYLNPLRIQISRINPLNSPRILIHLHHSVYDGWSLDMLLSDITRILKGEEEIPRPSFRDIVGFHQFKQSQEADDEARIFWTEHLAGWNKAQVPKLVRKASDSSQIGSTQTRLKLSRDQVEGIMKSIGCSPQVLFQASLALLWSGLSGASDVAIGSVTSGRTIPLAGIEKIIGPCIASLPLRVDLDTLQANLDLFNNLHSNNRQVMQHCGLPLQEIKHLAGLQPGESLYDVLFVYQESLDSQSSDANLVEVTRHLDRLETPLLFEVEPTNGGFQLQVTHRLALFPCDIVENFINQFEKIALDLLANMTRDIRSTRKLSGTEPSLHNISPREFQGVPDLARGFEEVVRSNPMDNALCFADSLLPDAGNVTMSFKELNSAANRVARYLRTQNVGVGQVVAVIMSKSPELYTAILGTVKAGCAYLPLLPSTPLARVQDILKQAGVTACLVDGEVFTCTPAITGVKLINLNIAPLQEFPDENLNIPADPSRLAYVIYTSGTTGVPKGVAVTQRNIVANIEHLKSLYPVNSGSQSRLLQACSQAFDVSVFEIFFTWHAGMCLCAAGNDTIFENLEYAIRQFQVTHLSMTPTVAALVDPRNVPDVEFLVTAGEPLTQAVLDRWGSRLWQGYGPSETTNICTVKQMAPDDHIENLGHALQGSSTFVLFPDSLELAPIGWVGEFCFGGDQVAHGYLNMPELTSAKFIDHPEFGRLYRTGDMGRMLPDGSLVILGRMDDQIKLRGQRIEISEINSVATSIDLVESVVTLLIKQGDAAVEQLALFYVQSSSTVDCHELEVSPEVHQTLLGALQSRLPSYMVPSYLVPITKVPLTSSGKVDRKVLQTCFHGLKQSYLEQASCLTHAAEDEAEWSPFEISLAEVISNVTNVPRDGFGRWTPLALLGVDSVSAIELARRISSQLEIRVAVSAILKHQTVAQLARHLTEAPKKLAELNSEHFFAESFVETVKKDFAQASMVVQDVLPCTPLQEAMLSRGQKSYYNKVLLRLHTDSERMREYWGAVTRRHDILRTCFVTTSDAQRAIAQAVLDNWDIPWLSFDVTEPSFDVAIHDHLKSLPEPIDSKKPPASLALIRYRSSVYLSFICHHALYDGAAMGNIWKEVEDLARGIELPPAVSYKAFLRAALDLPRNTTQFWTTQFHEYQPSTLFSKPSSEIDQCTHTTSLDLPLTDLHNRIRNLGGSLLSVCQSSWANVLAIAHNRPDVCFGNVVSGRTLDIEGLERLVAPCFNSIPIRANFPSRPTNLDLLKHFQTLNNSLMPYQFTPLRSIQRLVNRNGRHLFDTLLLLQKPLQNIDKEVWTLEEDSGEMDIPLVCEVVPCPGLNSLVVNIHRDMNLVTGETAMIMAETFKFLLQTTLMSPHSKLIDKQSLPTHLSVGLDTLKPRHDRIEIVNSCPSDQVEWTEIETTVRQVLSELSGVSSNQIHRQTTIFQLGLDSINAVQVASILRQQGFNISASDVIECPSCTKIAAKLLELIGKQDMEKLGTYNFDVFSQDVESQLKDIILDGAEVEAVLPCTSLQSAMLASFSQSKGDNYLNAVSYLIDDGIYVQDIMKAWKSLQARHPMLRTGFAPVQHRDTSFAMIRYKRDFFLSSFATLEESEEEDFALAERKRQFGEVVQASPCTPPWKMVVLKKRHHLSMNIIMHHALFDAASLHQMLDDVARSLRGERPHAFPRVEPALSTLLRKAALSQEEERVFWESKANQVVVNKFPAMTPLSTSTRNILADTICSRLSFTELRQATQRSNLTIQAVIQAAWTRVLSSYLGEDSVVFGVALSGRTIDAVRDAPFPCLNTVPIVAQTKASNAELTSYMMDYNQHLHKHQYSPLSQIQKWLGHPGSQIFDTLLAYQRLESSNLQPRPWKIVQEEAVVEYPVSMEVEPVEDDKINMRITYFDDVLPQGQAELMIRQFDAAMTHIANNPDGQQDEMYKESTDLFSVLPAEFPVLPAPVELLHQFVEREALDHPSKLALEFVSGWNGEEPIRETWSYLELNRMGDAVAAIIQSVAPAKSIVAIHFDKCPEAYFSILGILKAGCSFVALDPTAPKARKEFIIQDSGSPCVLANNTKSIDFQLDVPVVCIDKSQLSGLTDDISGLKPNIDPADTCYCLYTSGTTGTPKGCEITHENAVQAMMAFQDLFKGHWCEDSRWLQFAALHFDVSVLEQYWSWSVGIAVVAAPKDLILDDLTATLNRLEITHIDLTPSLARLTHPDEVPSLCRGVFITGGEQLKKEILDAWGPQGVIYNAYGPTEATIGVTMYQRVPVNGRPSNIGKQFLNVGSYVFRQGTEIPVIRGAVGELCVSGKLVGKGYLNRPELTQERFPTLGEFGERIYRTGDLVRVLYDGCFEFLGRADDQVKLRGQRLEIGEIDHAMRTGVPELGDCATIVTRHGQSGKDVLVSFIVGVATKETSLSVLHDTNGLGIKAKEACQAKLPGYMVPTYFFVLPYVPLSPNNKAEVKELKKLFGELSHQQLIEFSRTAVNIVSGAAKEVLSKLVQVLAQFSGTSAEELTPSTSIFDIGVDSITSLRLSALLKTRGFRVASPAMLLRYPVIADLANALAKSSPKKQDNRVREVKQKIQAYGHRYRNVVCQELGLTPADIEYIAPCSSLQQGIISRTMTSDPRDVYFNTFEMSLHNDASSQKLKTAWEDLFSAEAILRTVFVPTTDGFIQAALRSSQFPWVERSFEDEDLAQEYLKTSKEEWINQNASVVKKPLLLTLVTTPTSRRLVISIFHAIYDGNSFDLMMERIRSSYQQQEMIQGPPFIEVLAHGPLWRHNDCRKFWEDRLHDWKSAPMPSLTTQPQAMNSTTTRTIEATAVEAVRSSQNVTLQSVILALWTSVLQRYTRGPVTIGTIISGRAIELSNVDNTIGPLFNTVPFYAGHLQGKTWASLIRQCHDFNTAILDFQHVPLKDVQKWCSGGQPLFDNLFAFQIEAEENKNRAPWDIVDTESRADYPLALEATLTAQHELRLTLVAQGHIADNSGLEKILNELEEAIASARSTQEAKLNFQEGETMSHGEPAINSPSPQRKSTSEYEWTEQAIRLRQEIALLAKVNPQDVLETTSLLELGLDSIDVIKLSAKLKQQMMPLSPSKMMRCQTICNMISELSSLPDNPSSGSIDTNYQNIKDRLWNHLSESGVDLRNVESVLPPTPLQESMVAGMIQSDFVNYFNHDVLEISPDVDIHRLRTAWAEIIRHLPILRTSFIELEGGDFDITYCQVVSKSTELEVQYLQLDNLADVKKITSQATHQARDLNGRGNLLQLRFATIDSRNFLILSMAHALYDGWSLSLLFQNLYKAYHAQELHTTPSELFLSKIADAENGSAGGFWSQYLDGALPSMITQNERPTNGGAKNGDLQVLKRREFLSMISMAEINSFCRQQSVSLQVLCQACWAVVLAHHVQSLDVTFGVIVSGRDFEGSENLVFPTMNTVALRCILHGSSSAFLRYLEENMNDIRQYQHYPLRKAQRNARIQAQEFFNTLFILQRSPESSESTELLKSVEGSSATDYPICVEAETMGDKFIWRTAIRTEFSHIDEGPEQLLKQLDQAMQFFMASDNSDLLSFTEGGVSICGQPPFMTKDEVYDQTPITETTDGENWCEHSSSIREVLSQVSNVPILEIKKSDTLYHLGLDSISAIKVAALLRKRSIRLRPQDLIKAGSIQQMADMVGAVVQSSAPALQNSKDWEMPAEFDVNQLLKSLGVSENEVELLPALPMQVYMLSAWQNAEGSVFYPEFIYSIRGSFDLEAIESAWKHLVSETPLLRTCFVATGSSVLPFLQVIMKNHRVPPLHSSITEEAESGSQPLVRVYVDRQTDNEWTLHLRIHHALYDGVSLPSLMQRFAKLLEGAPPLDYVPQYLEWKRFAVSQQTASERDVRQQFWASYLSGCTSDASHVSLEGNIRDRTSYLKKAAVPDIQSLQAIAAKNGVSIQALFLAAYAEILAGADSGSEESYIVFGMYLANRTADHNLSSAYPTLNLVPIKVRIGGFQSLVQKAIAVQNDIHKISSDGLANVGLWEISAWTGIKITSFVNFLSLPDTSEDVEETVKALPLELNGAVTTEGVAAHLSWLEKNTVKNDYPVSLPPHSTCLFETSANPYMYSLHWTLKHPSLDRNLTLAFSGRSSV